MIEIISPPSDVKIAIDNTTLNIRSYDEDTSEPLRVDVYLNGTYLDSYEPGSDGFVSIPLTFKQRDNEVLLENDIESEYWYCTCTVFDTGPNITSVAITPNPVNAKSSIKVVVEVS